MKKVFYSLSIAALALGATACGGNKADSKDSLDTVGEEVVDDTVVAVQADSDTVTVAEEVVSAAAPVVEEVKKGANKVVESGKNKAEEVKDAAKDKAESVKDAAADKASQLLNKTEQTVKNGVSDAKEKTQEKLNKLK